MTITYSLDSDVNDRLRLKDTRFAELTKDFLPGGGTSSTLDRVRVRAKRSIDLSLTVQGVAIPTSPGSLSGIDASLKDIEADLAAAMYRGDTEELLQQQSPDALRSRVWRERATDELTAYLRDKAGTDRIRVTKEDPIP